MGKDKTVAAAPVAAVVKDSEDSVMDEIKSKNIMPTNLAKEVQDDIAKEEKDKKKSQLKRAIQHATYKNFSARLNLRKRRNEAKVTKDSLEKTAVLLSRLTGVTRDGKAVDSKDLITFEQYKDQYHKLKADTKKAMDEVEKTYRDEVTELDNTDCASYGNDYWL